MLSWESSKLQIFGYVSYMYAMNFVDICQKFIHTRYLVGLCKNENVNSNVMSPAAGTVPEDRKNDPGDKNIILFEI